MKLLLVFVGVLAAVSGWEIYSVDYPNCYNGYEPIVRSVDGSYTWNYDVTPISLVDSYLSYPSYEHYIIARSAPEEKKAISEPEHMRKRRSVVLEDENVRRARWEHEQAHLRVLAGLPAIPEGGFTFPYPQDTQEINEAKAKFIEAYGEAVQRNLVQSPYYSGLPMETSDVLTARARHEQAHRDALARLSGTYVPLPYQVYNTQEVRAVEALNNLAHNTWELHK
ncbi:uncharacterized protein LOC123291008 [Chrysoperla carnea]|uniref:uncharacterized protein LOC123291008 n=1 Tax=Chrysoperla carnea TaxID=189513 RepID=UPI001D0693BB|nr:uncharacterized protein LOC123291008 [Chrysoperla carnea]